MSMKVLVTGSREFSDYDKLAATLEQYYAYSENGMIVIHGDARGADKLADTWAVRHAHVSVVRVPADWENDGKAAGPIRNARMLELDPDYVVAFFKEGAANRGTQNMVDASRRKDVPVYEVRG